MNLSESIHYKSLKKELIEIIHWFHSKGWSPATSTNYSFRNPVPHEDTYTISRSGVDKSLFKMDDLMIVDKNGNPTKEFEHIKPSAETLLHTLLYENPETQVILHTHTVPNTVLSMIYQKDKQISLQGYEVLKGIHGIKSHEEEVIVPIFENSQDMPVLSAEIRGYYQKNPNMQGFLLAGHGLYTWGHTMAEAKRHMEVFEFLFECVCLKEKLR